MLTYFLFLLYFFLISWFLIMYFHFNSDLCTWTLKHKKQQEERTTLNKCLGYEMLLVAFLAVVPKRWNNLPSDIRQASLFSL